MIEVKKSITESKTFCSAPWTDLRLGHNGAVGICSYSPDIGNSLTDKIADILKNQTITDIKNCIKNEEWHDNCTYCKGSETHGGRSERLNMINSIDPTVKEKIDLDVPVLTNVSINWNNLCNLACTYCGENNSTKWAEKLSIPISMSRIDEESALEYILDKKDTVFGLLIGGGEPLLQKNIHTLINQLAKDHLNITLTTNLSVPLTNNPVFKTIIKHKNIIVNWMISFDGIGDKFEYVRDGASWDIFKKNIQILKDHGQRVIAHPAYGLYCATDVEEYCDFCVENELPIWWCDIFEPHELDIRFAPSEIRQLAINSIDKVLEKYQGRSELNLDTLIEYKKMAENGISFISDKNDDITRARKIIIFNHDIEQKLNKTTRFKNLWPDIQNILTNLSNKTQEIV